MADNEPAQTNACPKAVLRRDEEILHLFAYLTSGECPAMGIGVRGIMANRPHHGARVLQLILNLRFGCIDPRVKSALAGPESVGTLLNPLRSASRISALAGNTVSADSAKRLRMAHQ